MGYIDAALALASLRQALPFHCTPEFTARKKQAATTDLYHPLLGDPTAKAIAITGKSVLVYGSNMSGKTTFIRALVPMCDPRSDALYLPGRFVSRAVSAGAQLYQPPG